MRENSTVGFWPSLRNFIDHDPLTLSASIAFYTALSFAPIIVLGLWLVSLLSPGAEDRLVEQLGTLLGPQVGAIASTVMQHAGRSAWRADMAGLIGLGALLVSASTAFAQFQAAINTIWDVDAPAPNALWQWILRRLLSFGMIAVIGFLLMVALIASSALALVLTEESPAWLVVNEAITLVLFAVAFAGLFRHVPDARIPLRPALLGGMLTAILFEAGKWAIGSYLSSAASADAYGAASSLILMLLWVYYSSLIVLVGAWATRFLAERSGSFTLDCAVEPARRAVGPA